MIEMYVLTLVSQSVAISMRSFIVSGSLPEVSHLSRPRPFSVQHILSSTTRHVTQLLRRAVHTMTASSSPHQVIESSSRLSPLSRRVSTWSGFRTTHALRCLPQGTSQSTPRTKGRLREPDSGIVTNDFVTTGRGPSVGSTLVVIQGCDARSD